jgi:hypothetical protein
MVYGDVFLQIMLFAVGSGLICLVLSPLLARGTHPEAPEDTGA